MGSSSLRICHLGKFYPPAIGGIESHVRTLAQAQAALGAEVRVVCINHMDTSGRDVTWERFAVTETVEDRDGPVRVTRIGRRASIARLSVCPSLPLRLLRLIQGEIDVLHLHVPNPTMLLVLSGLRFRIPLVITYHSDVIKQKLLEMAQRPLEHLVFRQAAVILATSPVYSKGSMLLQHYRAKQDVLPLGIDLAPYLRPSAEARSQARSLKAEHGSPLWLSIGRLVYYKGLRVAIQALPSVPGKLMIIGHGPLERELRKLAEEVGVADRVIWHHDVSEDTLIGAYLAATALWFPSNERSEGFGLVQVEAMASGCPVINTMIPNSGVSWVSKHGETGLTVPMNDPAALAEAARQLLRVRGLRDRLASAAREQASARFDHLLMAERSLAIYHNNFPRSKLISSRSSQLIPYNAGFARMSASNGDRRSAMPGWSLNGATNHSARPVMDSDLTPDQRAEAQSIYYTLKRSTDADLMALARLLVATEADHLLSASEFKFHDGIHGTGAKTLETAP